MIWGMAGFSRLDQPDLFDFRDHLRLSIVGNYSNKQYSFDIDLICKLCFLHISRIFLSP